MEKPYVISAELELRNPRVTPLIRTESLDSIRDSLDKDLQAMGKNTRWVDANELQRGMNRLVTQSRLPVLSLDDRYITAQPDGRIGISRAVDDTLNDTGYAPRAGYVDIEKQFDAARRLGEEVQVVDDILFSGEMMLWISEQLKQRDMRIGRIVCGIAIGEGVDKLESSDIPVDTVSYFSEVEDELCERDFFIVPGSGRRISATKQNALYFDAENGKPQAWASIPKDSVEPFFISSLERSRQLIRPGTQMQQLGSFKGFDTKGDAVTTILSRIQEQE